MMPRKKNKRKTVQAAKQDAEPKPNRVAMIDPVHTVAPTLAAAAMLGSALRRRITTDNEGGR